MRGAAGTGGLADEVDGAHYSSHGDEDVSPSGGVFYEADTTRARRAPGGVLQMDVLLTGQD